MRRLTNDELSIIGNSSYALQHFTLDAMNDYTANSELFKREMGEKNYTDKPFDQWATSGQKAFDIAITKPCVAFAHSLLAQRYTGVPKQLKAYESMGFDDEVFTDYMLVFVDVIGKSHKHGKFLWEESVKFYVDNGFDTAKLRVLLEEIKGINFARVIAAKKQELKDYLIEMEKLEDKLLVGISYGIKASMFEYNVHPNNELTLQLVDVLISKCRIALGLEK